MSWETVKSGTRRIHPVAIIAAVINIILLIIFIHQIATNIQADKVVSDISEFISKQLETLFPERMGEEIENEKKNDIDDLIEGTVMILNKRSKRWTRQYYPF